MPLLRFPKQRFHPHLPLPKRLLVCLSFMVAAHPVQILLIETARDAPSLITIGTPGFERTDVARCCVCLVLVDSRPIHWIEKGQLFLAQTHVEIALCIISESLFAKERAALV